jgi:hypothetical protein
VRCIRDLATNSEDAGWAFGHDTQSKAAINDDPALAAISLKQ